MPSNPSIWFFSSTKTSICNYTIHQLSVLTTPHLPYYLISHFANCQTAIFICIWKHQSLSILVAKFLSQTTIYTHKFHLEFIHRLRAPLNQDIIWRIGQEHSAFFFTTWTYGRYSNSKHLRRGVLDTFVNKSKLLLLILHVLLMKK